MPSTTHALLWLGIVTIISFYYCCRCCCYSTWHILCSTWNQELQLENCIHQIGLWSCLWECHVGQFTWLMVDIGGPSPWWAMLSFTIETWESNGNKTSKQHPSLIYISVSASRFPAVNSCLTFLGNGLRPGIRKPNKSYFPYASFNQGVHHSNRNLSSIALNSSSIGSVE